MGPIPPRIIILFIIHGYDACIGSAWLAVVFSAVASVAAGPIESQIELRFTGYCCC